jgi:PKD repeat protein
MKNISTLIKQVLFCSLIIAFGSEISFAQNWCGTQIAMEKLYEQYPGLREEQKALIENSKQIAKNNAGRNDTLIIIPVVFHILHEYGTENITDQMVKNQVLSLNRDFSKTNSDLNTVIPEFQPIIGNAKLEFRLASLDFKGECTNGIDRIYSHETHNGDSWSKLNPWPREKYLNIWVVRRIDDGNTTGTTLGYAQFPSDVNNTFMYFLDGIVMISSQVNATSRTLAHEIGHYLGLSHPWGGGQIGVECGDDGVEDTPVTQGFFSTCPAPQNAKVCDSDIIENVQNIMDYSSCPRMFTEGQVELVRGVLDNTTAARNNLGTLQNLIATGTNTTTPAECTPVPDFRANTRYSCEGGTVAFTNTSWRAAVTSYAWEFPTGTPSTSTTANPSVKYDTWGWKKVTLTVTNSAGSETKTVDNFIYVTPPWHEISGTNTQSFQSTPHGWIVENPSEDAPQWTWTDAGGSNKAFGIINFINNPPPTYYDRLGGRKDALISPSYNLSGWSGTSLSFKYSCATKANNSNDLKEELKIYSSVDCGRTWTFRKTINGTSLANVGLVDQSFIPSSESHWTTETINIPSNTLQPNVRFKFEYTAGDKSNNIFIDDVSINGIVGIDEFKSDYFSLNIYPNPSRQDQSLVVSYMNSKGNNMNISITDLVGKVKYSIAENKGSGNHQLILNGSETKLSAGVYFITLNDGVYSQTQKVIVY